MEGKIRLNKGFLRKSAVAFATLFACLFPQTVFAQTQWSFGYWTGFRSDPYSDIQWNGLTHLGFQTVFPETGGTLDFEDINGNLSSSQTTWGPWTTSIITAAHNNNVKVILGLNVSTGAAWASATSPTYLSTFVSNLMSVVNAYGFDGIDIDWENSVNYTQYSNMLTALRTALGSKLLTVSPPYGNASFFVARAAQIDRLLVQTYGVYTSYEPLSWFSDPLYSDSGTSARSMDSIVQTEWIAQGFPAAKILAGFGFYGYTINGVSGPRQSGYTGGASGINYRDIVANYNPGAATWDSPTHTPWLNINSSSYITFDNARSVADKIAYAKAQNLGGWMIWNVDLDWISGGTPRHPLLAAVAAAMASSGTSPTISSFTASPSTINSGSSSTLSWSTSGATSFSINQGVGTVTGTSVAVSPTATTTYTLTATNSAGSVTKSVTVTVAVNSPPPTISSFAANPAITGPGGSSMLSWATTGATSLSISPTVGIVTNSTTQAVSPTATTTYTLTATNSSGSATQPVTVTVSSAPVAYWKFDDGTGTTATDSSGNGHNMGLFNAPSWVTASSCAVNGCLDFNGTNQYGSSALDLSGTNVITVAFWLKWSAYANDNRSALEFTPNFNNASTGFLILPDESASGQFQAGIQGNAGYNQVDFPRPSAGVWHHYAFVMNKGASAATQVLPYVDGQAISYTKPAAAANTNNFGKDLLFAMSRAGTSLFGSGNLDEVRIYPRALSAAEILSLVTASSPNITTTSPLQVGTVGLPYWQTLTSSGSTPITWTLTSGALPAGLFLSSSNGAISGTPSTASSFSFIVGATNTAGTDSQQFSLTVNPNSSALNYNVSDLNWMSATIGWGTIHKNASVLGNVVTLNGVTYTEGIGTHADSQIVYNIGGECNTFQSYIGIDDEVGSAGSVDFQVFGDGAKLYDSALMTGSSATQKISVSVAGRTQLRLIVNHGGTSINFDHADWANPRLACSSVPPAAN